MPMPWPRSSSARSPITQTPGWFISTIAEIRSAVPSHSTGTSAGVGTGLPSSATTRKAWPGNARLRISPALRVQHMKQHPLALLDADRLAVAKHPAVDGEELVADLVSFGPFELLVGLLPRFLQFLDRGAARKSMAMSPPRLNAGSNSFNTRKTSRS